MHICSAFVVIDSVVFGFAISVSEKWTVLAIDAPAILQHFTDGTFGAESYASLTVSASSLAAFMVLVQQQQQQITNRQPSKKANKQTHKTFGLWRTQTFMLLGAWDGYQLCGGQCNFLMRRAFSDA